MMAEVERGLHRPVLFGPPLGGQRMSLFQTPSALAEPRTQIAEMKKRVIMAAWQSAAGSQAASGVGASCLKCPDLLPIPLE